MKRLSGKLTYANVISTLALFLVLAGGTAIAAKQMLPKNSVGTKQIENGSITAAKIKKGSITGAQINLSQLGTVPSASHASTADSATSAGHANSADSATHASSAISADTAGVAQTAQTALNLVGADGPLASGRTLTGLFGVAGHVVTEGEFVAEYPINFQIPLTEAPEVVELKPLAAPTPECPGSVEEPKAAPGTLCLYEEGLIGATELRSFPTGDARRGLTVFEGGAPANTDYEVWGIWAVTAP
jgi:hypothetical protein